MNGSTPQDHTTSRARQQVNAARSRRARRGLLRVVLALRDTLVSEHADSLFQPLLLRGDSERVLSQRLPETRVRSGAALPVEPEEIREDFGGGLVRGEEPEGPVPPVWPIRYDPDTGRFWNVPPLHPSSPRVVGG